MYTADIQGGNIYVKMLEVVSLPTETGDQKRVSWHLSTFIQS